LILAAARDEMIALTTSSAAAGFRNGAATSALGVTEPFPASRAAWYVTGALAVTNMVSYVERQIPTLMFGPIKHDFGLSDTKVSLLAGFAFVLFYVGFGLFIGRLADRTSRKRIIAIGIVLWGFATMSCGLARSFVQLFLGRVMVGVGEATLGPSAISMLSDYFPRGKLARAVSVYTGAQYLGAGFALVVGGLAIHVVDSLRQPVLPLIGALHPWQTTFLVVGAVGMLVIIPVLFIAEPKRRGLLNASDVAPSGPLPIADTVKFVRQNWKTLGAHFSAFSISSAMGFGTVAWIPTYFIRIHHWAAHDIGYVYGLMLALLGGAGVLAGARFGEWLASRGFQDAYFRAPLITLSLTGIPAALATLMPNAEASLILLVFSTFLSSFPVALIIASLQLITPNQMRGQIVSFYFFVANIFGVGLGPTLVAMITDYVYHDEMAIGYSLATATAVITPIVALILWLGLRPYRESLARAATWSGHSDEGIAPCRA
jgi:MFS family permease